MGDDPFKKLLESDRLALKQDLLQDIPKRRYPDRLDWLARRIAVNGSYTLRPMTDKQTSISRGNFDRAARKLYLSGLYNDTGRVDYLTALDDDYPLGGLIIQYAGLLEGLSRVNKHGIDPGDALGRLIARDVRRRSRGEAASIASTFQAETYTPRGLVEQVLSHPELAASVRSAMPGEADTAELVDRLCEVKVATQLWDHQLLALCEWLYQESNGYVNMATATGKTVLGLAAVAYYTDSGGLHPEDEDEVEEWFGDATQPTPHNSRPSDVLIVTTDDLLGVQWARLFREHCNTPAEFTEIVDQTIEMPWGDIDIRPANGLGNTDPADYRVAIFDEVHNYSSSGGWGEDLIRYIESSCPVLALTGSVNDEMERRFRQADAPFPCVYEYTHDEALRDGVIPDFEWTLEYVPVDAAESTTLSGLRDTASAIDEHLVRNNGGYAMDPESPLIQAIPEESRTSLTTEHDTHIGLGRALGQVEGAERRADAIEALASGLTNRLTYWWNLRLELKPVVDIVNRAMADEKPTLLLTRSYKEGDRLYRELKRTTSDIKIQKLEQEESATDQDSRITDFDGWETGRKVLIGPGSHIGTGNDIQSVEVGINLARPGTGMSNSLIQRLGRLLRQPGNKERVSFHHLLGVPPADAIAPMDGPHFVRDAVGFFAQTKTEGGSSRMTKVPSVTVSDTVEESILELENYGYDELADTETTLDAYEQAYVDALGRSPETELIIDTDWYASLFDGEINTGDSSLSGQRPETEQSPEYATEDSENTTNRKGAEVVITISAEDGGVPNAFVTVVGQNVRTHGRTNIAGEVGFDIESPGEYRIASRSETGEIATATVTVDDVPTNIDVTLSGAQA